MPIIAVAAAGFALASGGAAAIGAVVAGTATLATTLSAVTAVGATLGAVGAITGDKTLSTIGMVMGGIGGVGALAANAGLFGASATSESLFGSTIGEVSSTPVNSAFAGEIANDGSLINGGASAMSGYSPGDVTRSALSNITPGGSNDFIDTLAGTVKPVAAATNPVETVTSTAAKGATTYGETDALSSVGSGASTAAQVQAAPAGNTVTGKSGTPEAPTVMKNGIPDVRIPGNVYKGVDGKTYTSDGVKFTAQSEGGIWNFLKTAGGGALGMGALQAGGAFLQGATDELKPAQIEAYKAQAAANNAATALTQRQVDNMNSPIPVARRVEPTPVTGSPRSLINNQPMAGAAA